LRLCRCATTPIAYSISRAKRMIKKKGFIITRPVTT
jgi:hypothetical protein